MHALRNLAIENTWLWPERLVTRRSLPKRPISAPVQVRAVLDLPVLHAPVSEWPGGKLLLAIVVSAMLHVALVLAVSSTLDFRVVSDAPHARLNVDLVPELRAAPPPPPVLAEAPVVAEPLPPIPPNRLSEAAKVEPPTRQARFLTDPDLSILEQIPASMPGAISLRLFVTAQGNVERVTVLRSDPVPRELLEGLVERFGAARLSPATVDGEARASTLEVTIRVDPGAFLLDPTH